MKDIFLKKYNYIFVLLSIIAAIYFHIDENGQHGLPTIFQLFLLFQVILIYIQTKFINNKNIIILNRIYNLFIIYTLFVLLIRFTNTYNLWNTFHHSTLYDIIKYSVMSMFSIFVCFTGFNIGIQFKGNELYIRKILILIILSSFINSFIVLISWYIQTGGQFGRYNFILPIFHSYGLSATLSYTGLLFIIPFWSSAKYKLNKTILLIVASILALSILVISSRQCVATAIALIVIYTLFNIYQKGLSINKFIIYTLLIIIFVSLSGFYIDYRKYAELYYGIFDLNDYGISGRLNSINESINIFLNYYLIGVGYGNWYIYTNYIFGIHGGIVIDVASPHNGFFCILSEFGIIGSIIFSIIIYLILKQCYFSLKYSKTIFLHNFNMAVITLLITLILSQLFSNSLLLPIPFENSTLQYVYIIWLLLGLSCGNSNT